MSWQTINKNESLQPGDVIRLHYKRLSMGIIDDAIGYLVEKKLRGNPQYELLSWHIDDKQSIYTIKIKQPEQQLQQAGVNPTLIASIILVALSGVAGWFLLDKIEKLVEKPAGQLAAAAIGTVIIGIVVAIIVRALKK